MTDRAVADIVYTYTGKMTGIRRYSEKLITALERTGTHVRPHRIRKIETSIGGKPAGGLISQKFFSLFIRTTSPVIHSLSPDVIMKKTNVATIHDLIPFYHKETFMKTRRERLGYSIMFSRLNELTIIVHTNFIKTQLIEQGIDGNMIEVAGASIQDFFRPSARPSPYPSDGRRHLVTVGDFNPRKRFDVIYRAVNQLDGVDLYHIGPVNSWVQRYRELREIAQRGGKIHLLGALSDSQLVDYISHADLFVYATVEEGAGYPPAEALACGTKVLVNKIPVFLEQFGDDVFYCDLEVDSFTGGIADSLNKEVDRGKLLRAASRFSADAEAARVAAVYAKVGASLKS